MLDSYLAFSFECKCDTSSANAETAVIAIPRGLAFKDTFSASLAAFVPTIAAETVLKSAATDASPPILENANPTASEEREPIKS